MARGGFVRRLRMGLLQLGEYWTKVYQSQSFEPRLVQTAPSGHSRLHGMALRCIALHCVASRCIALRRVALYCVAFRACLPAPSGRSELTSPRIIDQPHMLG